MSSGAASGRKGRFVLRETIGSGIWIPLKSIKSIDRAGSQGEEEFTNFDSEDEREFLPGFKEATYDILCNDLHGLDPGQEILLNARDAGSRPEFRYYPKYEPLSGKNYYQGLCFSTSDNVSNPLEGPGDLSLTMRASGESRKKQLTVQDKTVEI